MPPRSDGWELSLGPGYGSGVGSGYWHQSDTPLISGYLNLPNSHDFPGITEDHVWVDRDPGATYARSRGSHSSNNPIMQPARILH